MAFQLWKGTMTCTVELKTPKTLIIHSSLIEQPLMTGYIPSFPLLILDAVTYYQHQLMF